MGEQNDCLIVLTKFPRPSYSKTRLAATIGNAAAAKVSECFLIDLIRRLIVSEDLRLIVAGAFIDKESEFNELFEKYSIPLRSVEIILPRGKNMMDDISASYEYTLKDSRKVGLTATDIPYLTVWMVKKLFSSLDKCDLAFYPNLDGTVCPHAMKEEHIGLFDGLEATYLEPWLSRIQSLNISFRCLEPIFDIDRIEDLMVFYRQQLLMEYRAEYRRDSDGFCPETIKFLKILLSNS